VADITVREMTGFGLATILPRRGVGAEALGSALGFPVTGGAFSSSGASAGEGLALWGTGPGQWLAFADLGTPGWADALGETLVDVAAVVDQSGAYSLLHIAGSDARRLLQKGLPVDLSPGAFAPGAVVVSAVAHIGVIVHQDSPTSFHLAVFRSFAGSFRHWLEPSIAAL
jgi:methylglutamate dehydrogenase subunit D